MTSRHPLTPVRSVALVLGVALALGVAAVTSGTGAPPSSLLSALTLAAQDDPAATDIRAERAAVADGRQARAAAAAAAAKAAARATAQPAAPRPVVRVAAPVHRVVVAAPRAVTAAPVAPRPAETYLQRGQRLLAALHYPYQKLGYRIEFLPERHGYLGFTDANTKLIQIWVRSSESDLVLSHSIAHEIGHALDFTYGSPARHALYLSIRGLSTTMTWFGCNGCTDYQTPAGDWAEVFANWVAGPGDFRSQVSGPPSAAQRAALGALFQL